MHCTRHTATILSHYHTEVKYHTAHCTRHTATLQSNTTLPQCHTSTLPHCHNTTLLHPPQYHTVIDTIIPHAPHCTLNPPHCHTAVKYHNTTLHPPQYHNTTIPHCSQIPQYHTSTLATLQSNTTLLQATATVQHS